MKRNSFLLFALLVCEIILVYSQTSPPVYHQEPVPDPFTQGTRYPNRDEDVECRSIKLRVRRNSLRFHATITQNSNSRINFETSDASLMTSRMKSRLDILASWYYSTYGTQLRVLMSYIDGNDPGAGADSSVRSNSLHYEGRSARIRGSIRSHLPAIARQAVLSGFDWVYYADQDYCRVSVIPDICQTDIDLVFLVDESGSVGSANYQLAVQFMQSVVNFFDVEANRTRVAMISFSTNASINFFFSDYLSNQAVNDAIGRTTYRGGYTHTAWALYFARLIFHGPNLHLYGARPLSAGIPRVVVLITDGHSNHYRVDDQAMFLRQDSGATIYSVGVANYDIAELNLIASDPDSEHVFLLQSYSDAASFVQLLSGTTCDTPAILPPGSETDTECEEDDFRYFQIECPVFSATVIVEQIDIVGHCAIYISTTIVNPGPLNSAVDTVRNETLNVNRRRVTIRITSTTTSIYVSIRGITPMRNRFRMVVWNVLFAEEIYSVTVSNGVITSNSIINLDVISGNDANYAFGITEGNEDGKFRIGSNTGQIYLTEALNAEQQDFYNLTIVAYLRSNDCQRGRTYVQVYVSAANQNPPIFQSTSPVSVFETFPPGMVVVTVTATDADFGINGEVRYSITGSNTDNAFAIDPVTGAISVATALNHTILSSYTLTLTATDQAANNRRTDTTTQVINILDVNQSPFFLTACARVGACSLTVSEDRPINGILNTISGGDPDLSTIANGQLDYSITPTNTPFSINNRGRIRLVESLDRETRDTYLLNLTVSDRGSPPISITAAITYTVTDVNDNSPVVTIPTQVTISEGAFVGDGVLQASATDADIGVNAQVMYTLDTGSPLFAIDATTGAIILARSLDYEQNTEHSIVVSASNPDGLLSSPRTSTVLVINENDNSPIFTMDQYTASVDEGSSTGTLVITVQADDADVGTLGEVSYSITSGNSNDNFAINSTSGEITVNGDIDREVISEYTLTIRAQDGGSPARSDRSIVVITINDVNDNSPIFQRSSYTITVREDINVPADLLTLVATDADEAGSQNSAITYSIQTGNTGSVFNLATNTGVLSVTNSLDFESTPSYSLDVVATDGGSRTGSAVVTVTVTDVNDEAPTLSADQTVSLREDTSTPSVIANFSASGEMGEVLQFQLSGSQNGEFVIDATNGEVSLVQSLDYESRQEFRLTVSVTDGQFSTSSRLTITVTDVNDNTPIIDSASPFTIVEERPSNSLVGSVSASDRDSGSNAQLSFRITQQPLNLFMIVPDGGSAIQIRTATVLDREALVQMNHFLPPNSQSDITIEVSDNGSPRLTSSVTVVIRLEDINDNAPTLVNPVSEVNISESSNIGTVLTRVVASDVDIGVNALVSYSLTGSSLFTIDSSTGTITLAGSLDYETRREHTIMVIASNPDRIRSPEHIIVVRVIDENDNSPIFTMDPYTASVEEHSSTGTQVMTVEATDADSGVLGEVRYSIISGNIGAAFSISETTGLISVNADTDRELIGAYTLTVAASNPGTSSQMSTSRVEITITDINDNPPLFMQSLYTLSLREDAPLVSILTVVVTDADEPGNANSQFVIAISSDNEDLFTISSPSGVLSLSSSLDFEVESTHELNLTATDRGIPSMSSTAVVQITVVNVNDNPPMISGNQTVRLAESTAVGIIVAQFTSTMEQGETLEFSITSTGLLAIDSETGVVTLAQSLDYETQQSFTAQVSVSDGLFSSSAYLTVNVLDENDNAPQIAQAGPFSITEEMPAGTLVGTVTASDADSVGGPLTFSFLGTDILSFFNISSPNGEIRTASVLDREALTSEFSPPSSSQTFTVSVSDGASSSTVDITFQLLDINDNEPVFTNLLSRYDINENSAIGTEVFTVTATDADLGSNAVVSYSISSSPFIINENTGSVTVNASLDYEDVTEYSVTITASDGTLSSNRLVTIGVIDVNDNAPVFSMSGYTAQVAEHSDINTPVANISATDDDSGAFGMISYALEGTNGVFRIDSTTGEVVINQDIDRELVTQFTFTVVASDGDNPAMSASSSVVVSISDINDNAPVFQQSSYAVRVREDTAVSTEIITILATDADEMGNPNSQIDYSFETSSSVFSISATGAITLTSSLDFETTSSYSLTAVATDRGNQMMSGRTDVTITVVDVNDQPPVLTGDQSITLSELTAVPDQIARFTATSDAGEALEYELTGAQNGEFEINMTTGVVTLVQSLDYEGTQFYALTVTASDTMFSTPSAFNITVTDENDNIPQFDTVDVLEITEEQSVGTRVGQVTALDDDSGENAMISYSFVQSSTENYFTINSNTGEIVTADTLDRELLVQENLFLPPLSQITFQVQATDMGNPPLFSQIDITVRLNDINDNRPSFVNSDRQGMIAESAALRDSVTTVTATDPDLGSNALVSYSLSGSSLFIINSTTGVISVAEQLDYEMSRQHAVSITAVNPDGLASMQNHNITIFVTDVNDNSPIFTTDTYTVQVDEHSDTGTLVITVEADDADSGLFGQVRYSITNHDANVFSINETSGAISVNGDIDRETVDSYTFTVQATDSGSVTAQRSAVATVNIIIADINDNVPVFDQLVYRYSVREDMSIPMQLLTVSATDDDLSNSPNSRVSYSINNGVGLFEIDDATGSFSVTSSLDFETQSSYTIQVMATDNGQPSLNSTAQIVINVINVNDQLPQLSGDQRIELSELTTSMSRVTQYTATGEEGETLMFSLVGDGAGTVFDIDSTTGIVTLLTTLDFEMTPFYSYMVTVSDGTFTSSPSSLNITVLDENDNTPQFTSNNLIAFEEEISINTLIGQINATDIDSGVNGQLSYSFVEPRANTFFTINPSTGEITTAVVVDREGLAAMNALIMQSRIMFDVQVSDNGNPARFSTQTVTFEIIDINDNAPELNPPMMISISEAAIVGHVITDLSAVDRDLGDNALISYSLTGPVQFTISSTTGVVTLASSLDYETNTEHIITVTASNPDGLRSTEHNITIRVIDENDNLPIFTMDPYRVSVEEHSGTGTPVITVQADDADSGVLGQVSYSITSGNNEDTFIVNTTTGSLTVNSDIDRETSDTYTLGVMATDGGGRSAQSRVEIIITDINDNSPVFSPSSYTITVYENASINSNLITVTATDADAAGPNSDISYSIPSGNDGNLFRISSTGVISIVSALDFETAMSHSLIVQATDNGTPSRTSTAVVSVTVMDVNDVPVTLGNDQVVNVSEYATVNSRIAQFRAVDVEQSDNIRFSLSVDNNFQIDAATGVVTLAQSLDYEMTISYVLAVTVSDGVFSDTAQLTVNVVDENDNQPTIETTGPLMIDEEMDDNAIVGQVTATDRDSGLNGQIQFSIVSNIGGNLFTINASTGIVRTTAVLDREALENLFAPPDSEQVLVVQAEDRGTPSLFTQADVTIQLMDINDNSPQFVDEPSSFSLPENIPINTFILDGSATDADLGANGEVSYSLTSDTSSLPFSIDPSTGAVTTIATLDREQIDFYTITVTATDNGTLSRLMSSFIVNVTVTDINDNAPVFQNEPYGESIPEDASTDGGGSIDLLRVFAIDSDIGTNAIVTYSLAPDTNRRFSIRSTTGDLRVSGGINFEEETEFNITVIARDMGIPALSSITVATITIINVDEFAPVFIGSCDASISEARNVSRDSNPVTQCIAVDQDSGFVDYSIVIEPGNPALSAFLLNQLTGEVFLTQSLDRETIESYQFTLQASSGGSLITEMTVTITVEDVNDNAPVFSPSQIAVTYSDGQAQSIATLTVTDDDINENAEVSVDITSVVRTNQPDGLDTHEIIITAEDMGVPSMSGSATVVVTNAFPCQIMQFSLDPDTLQLSVATLCSLTNPPMSQDYLLGTEVILDCTAVSNLPVMYQWQLNGSFITNPSANPLLNLSRIDIDDIGTYSCIARTDIGSIQSVTAFIGINTIPEIIRPPESNAVEIGRTLSLTCLSTGIPDPTVTFFHKAAEIQLDSRVVQHEHFLVITNADEGDNGEYYCRAENIAGAMQSEPARIVVFSNSQVITTTILVNNPSDDGTCHNLDIGMIEDLLQDTTGYGAEVTMAEADGFCNSGPCYPNPCMNDGKCSTNENATGGYECACPDTFEGNNCEIDIDECTEEDPCFGGTCANTIGGFSCSCPPDRTGHRCQYQIRCTDDDLCTNDTTCVETLVNIDGYVCDSTPDDMTLIISLSNGVGLDQLGEAVYDLTNLLVMSANTNRKRRQVAAASSDVCEPRFIPLNDDSTTFKLIWACPDDDTDNDTDTTSASLEIQELICTTLLDKKIITNCIYSNGESAVIDTQTLSPIEVSVTFIMLDPVTNVPITGSEAVKVLGDTETLTAFETAGIQASPFTAAVPSTDEPGTVPGRPGNEGSSSSNDSGLGGGSVAGIVIGILIVAALGVVGAIAVLYYIKTYRKHAKYGINESKTASTLMRNIENGRDRTQTVVGVFENPTFRRSVMLETAIPDDEAFSNPAYQDPKIAKLDGNTKPVDKNAINRL